AGGWHDDTICEDTDLSYRAHLAGFRGVFLRDVPCPSELPVQVSALKSQQHRWAKGLTECFLKLMPLLWRSRLPLRKKLDASFHLRANFAVSARAAIAARSHADAVRARPRRLGAARAGEGLRVRAGVAGARLRGRARDLLHVDVARPAPPPALHRRVPDARPLRGPDDDGRR